MMRLMSLLRLFIWFMASFANNYYTEKGKGKNIMEPKQEHDKPASAKNNDNNFF